MYFSYEISFCLKLRQSKTLHGLGRVARKNSSKDGTAKTEAGGRFNDRLLRRNFLPGNVSRRNQVWSWTMQESSRPLRQMSTRFIAGNKKAD
jgi:hypothetical protein